MQRPGRFGSNSSDCTKFLWGIRPAGISLRSVVSPSAGRHSALPCHAAQRPGRFGSNSSDCAKFLWGIRPAGISLRSVVSPSAGRHSALLAGMAGLEPAMRESKSRALTAWLHPYGKEQGRSRCFGPAACSGVGEGTRTLDTRNHNPMLYQLNYAHHIVLLAAKKKWHA